MYCFLILFLSVWILALVLTFVWLVLNTKQAKEQNVRCMLHLFWLETFNFDKAMGKNDVESMERSYFRAKSILLLLKKTDDAEYKSQLEFMAETLKKLVKRGV